MAVTTNPRIAAERRKRADQRTKMLMEHQSKEAEKAGVRSERLARIAQGQKIPPVTGRESVKRPTAARDAADRRAAGQVKVYGGSWMTREKARQINLKQGARRRERRIARGQGQRLSFQLEGEDEVTLTGGEAKRATRTAKTQGTLDAMAARGVTRPAPRLPETPREQTGRLRIARYKEDLARPPADELAVSDLMLAGKSRQEALQQLQGTQSEQGAAEPYKGADLLRAAMPPRQEAVRPAQAAQAAPQAAPMAPAPVPAVQPAQAALPPEVQQIQQEMAGQRVPNQVPLGGETPAQSQAWAQQWAQAQGYQLPQQPVQPQPMPQQPVAMQPPQVAAPAPQMAPMPQPGQFATWMSDTGTVAQPQRMAAMRPPETIAAQPQQPAYGTPEAIPPEQQAAAAARMAQINQELGQLYAAPPPPMPGPARGAEYMRPTPAEAAKTQLIQAQTGGLRASTAAATIAVDKVKRDRLTAILGQIDGIGEDPGLGDPLKPSLASPLFFTRGPEGFAPGSQTVFDDVSRMLAETADDPALQKQVAERIAQKPWYKKIAAGYPESIEQNYGWGSRTLSGMTKAQQDHWVGVLKAIRAQVQTILQ